MGSDPHQRSVDNIKPEITAIKNNQKEILSILNKLKTVSVTLTDALLFIILTVFFFSQYRTVQEKIIFNNLP